MLSETPGVPDSPHRPPRKMTVRGAAASPTGLGAARYLQLFERLNPLMGLDDPQRIAAKACDLIAALLDVAACSLLLAEPGGESLQLLAATHIPQSEWAKIHVSVAQTVSGKALREGHALLINGRAAFRKHFGREPYERYLTPSCALVPLPILGRVAGVVNVAHPIGRRAFRQRDVALLEAATNIIGAALATANQMRESRARQEYLSDMLNTLHVGVLAVDVKGKVSDINKRMMKILGIDEGQAKGTALTDLLPANLGSVCGRLMRDSLSAEEPIQDRLHETLAGKQRLLEITAAPMRPLVGAVDHHLLIFEDVSREEEVKRLRESESMKRSFLAIISHELRTPIAVIKPALDLISPAANATPETAAQVHKMLVKNVRRLNDVINAILDVTEIENGTLRLAPRPTDLHEVLDEVISLQTERAQQKDIRLEHDFSAPLPLITADRRRLRQVFSEMMDNALKFCAPGNWIKLSARLAGDWIEVELANNGPMIPAERRDGLFEKFYQCESAMTRAAGGCGLGLFLVRNLLKMHGGSITLKESSETRTAFLIRLPLQPPEAEPETPPAEPPAALPGG